MFYLALFLIFAGLVSLAILVLSLSRSGNPTFSPAEEPLQPESNPSAETTTEEPPSSRKTPGETLDLPEPGPRVPLPDPEEPMENRKEADSALPKKAPPPEKRKIETPEPPLDSSHSLEESKDSTISSGPELSGSSIRLREALSLLEDRIQPPTRNREVEEPPQLIVSGVLFLDHSKQIQYLSGNMEEIPERFFSEMKRVDRGSLVIQGSRFQLLCQNANYAYSASELEQILFLQGGVALVPLSKKRPIPVFLTVEMDRVREYVQKHASISESAPL